MGGWVGISPPRPLQRGSSSARESDWAGDRSVGLYMILLRFEKYQDTDYLEPCSLEICLNGHCS